MLFIKFLKEMSIWEWIIIFMVIIILMSAIFADAARNKTKPVFNNGEVVTYEISGEKCIILDNKYKFDTKNNCWQIEVRTQNPVSSVFDISIFYEFEFIEYKNKD